MAFVTRNYFKELWNLQAEWSKGIVYSDILDSEKHRVFFSHVPGQWYNLGYFKNNNISDSDLKEIELVFEKREKKPAICLLEEQIKEGYQDFLIRQGYKFAGRDSWMGYDKTTYLDNVVHSKIKKVDASLFPDYDSVLSPVFSDFAGNKQYMEILKGVLSGKIKNNFPGLELELYLIYDGGKSVAGAGMFYSKDGNFAYLHDAGTLEAYRGKGYQSDLIRYRINKALGMGIDRIYSSVEHGDKSWSNSIKCGLNTMHTSLIFVK